MAADRNFALQSMSRNIIASGAKREIKSRFEAERDEIRVIDVLRKSEKASNARSQRLGS